MSFKAVLFFSSATSLTACWNYHKISDDNIVFLFICFPNSLSQNYSRLIGTCSWKYLGYLQSFDILENGILWGFDGSIYPAVRSFFFFDLAEALKYLSDFKLDISYDKQRVEV